MSLFAKRQRGLAIPVALVVPIVVALGVTIVLSWAGSGLAIAWLNGKVETAQKAEKKAVAALAAEEQSRKGFEAAGLACSASVERLEAEAEKRVLEHQAKLAASRKQTAAAESYVDQLLATPRASGLDECQAMKKELDDEIDRRAARSP